MDKAVVSYCDGYFNWYIFSEDFSIKEKQAYIQGFKLCSELISEPLSIYFWPTDKEYIADMVNPNIQQHQQMMSELECLN